MRSLLLSTSLAVLLCASCGEGGLEPLPSVSRELVSAAVKANNSFALDLHRALAEQESGNIFVSPFSVSTALGMVYAGARGETASQMADVLGFSRTQNDVHPALAWLTVDLRNQGKENGYALSVANRIWRQRGFALLASFTDLLEEHYGAGVGEVDFAGAPETSRKTINQWVSDNTAGKIPELLKSDALDASTRVVLANAIYFKADWLTRFSGTSTGPFSISETETVDVPMMHGKVKIRLGGDQDIGVVELPYAGDDVVMDILTSPDLAALEQTLDAARLEGALSSLGEHELQVMMPKFEVRFDAQMRGLLGAMGMPDLFEPGLADLSGMNGQRDLVISDVWHQAYVKVDESGTEAAAATAAGGILISATSPIEISSPFLFLIRDISTGAILFMGRIVDPRPS